jgi:nuclear transport factor 2 (NTF2) superfamily protein
MNDYYDLSKSISITGKNFRDRAKQLEDIIVAQREKWRDFLNSKFNLLDFELLLDYAFSFNKMAIRFQIIPQGFIVDADESNFIKRGFAEKYWSYVYNGSLTHNVLHSNDNSVYDVIFKSKEFSMSPSMTYKQLYLSYKNYIKNFLIFSPIDLLDIIMEYSDIPPFFCSIERYHYSLYNHINFQN